MPSIPRRIRTTLTVAGGQQQRGVAAVVRFVQGRTLQWLRAHSRCMAASSPQCEALLAASMHAGVAVSDRSPPRCAPSPSRSSRRRSPSRCWTSRARISRTAGRREREGGARGRSGGRQAGSKDMWAAVRTMRSKGMVTGPQNSAANGIASGGEAGTLQASQLGAPSAACAMQAAPLDVSCKHSNCTCFLPSAGSPLSPRAPRPTPLHCTRPDRGCRHCPQLQQTSWRRGRRHSRS